MGGGLLRWSRAQEDGEGGQGLSDTALQSLSRELHSEDSGV